MKIQVILFVALVILVVKPLHQGSANAPDVKEIQSLLTELCFDPGPIDGVWTEQTETSVKEFFSKYPGEYSGEIGPDELRSLRIVKEAREHEAFFNPKNSKLCSLDQAESTSYRKSLSEKLAGRNTLNPFTVWNVNKEQSGYGLIWNCCPTQMSQRINIASLDWNYSAVGTSWGHYTGVDKFLLNKTWGQGADIYGKKIVTNYVDSEFHVFITDKAVDLLKKYDADGVFLDWWHDDHQPTVKFSKSQVREARKKIAARLMQELGPDKIIIANVNWRIDRSTVGYLNGINLELGKKPFPGGEARLYNQNELEKIEQLLVFYENNLRPPKIIAPIFMRKNSTGDSSERNSPENRRMAKLLTSMLAVITTNGYVLYADNTLDSVTEDYDHRYYDFYNFEIGTPKSGYEKLAKGVGIKFFQEGFIAYNRTKLPYELNLNANTIMKITERSGLFCKAIGDGYDCLPLD